VKRIIGTLAVLTVALAIAPAARATFPGRDGELAVVPVVGPGLEYVQPGTGTSVAVCPSVDGPPGYCPVTGLPSWSPDGRLLAFGVESAGIMGGFAFSGIDLLDATGRCVACNLHLPLPPESVTAFNATGRTLTVNEDGGLSALPADGMVSGAPAQPLNAPGATHADWSSHDRLAIARRGAIWTGAPGRLVRLSRGAAPSWSPSGARLAYATRGWIVVQRPGGRARRLARGAAPVWSPDGHTIAFFGHAHRLELIAASGGRTRRVGTVTGDEASWQPRPAPAATCPQIPGQTTVAAIPPVQVAAITSTNTGYLACDTATGEARLVASGVTDPRDIRAAIAGETVVVAGQAGAQAAIWATDLGVAPGAEEQVPVFTGTFVPEDVVAGPAGTWGALVDTASDAEILADGRVVDVAPSVGDLTGLTLTGATLSWSHDGMSRSLPLSG
jgi:hypothetical protein